MQKEAKKKNLLQLYVSSRSVWITNVEQLMTAHLWTGPCGGLAHAEHRLVLGTIQPANREPGAADPGHHGDVAVSEEEAVQKMIHEEKDWKMMQRDGEGRKKPKQGSEEEKEFTHM